MTNPPKNNNETLEYKLVYDQVDDNRDVWEDDVLINNVKDAVDDPTDEGSTT
jgi:hypothetical protein